jgi:uncharacterized protein (TIGR03437 family)
LEAGAAGTTVPVMANSPVVRIGGQTALVVSTTLLPGVAGVYLIFTQVPANAPLGNAVSVQITSFEGQASNTTTMAISQ